MIDIRDIFHKKPEAPPADTTMQHKLARHRRLTFYKICAVIAAITVLFVCIYYHIQTQTYTTYQVKQEYEWTRTEGAQCQALGNTLITYSKDGISCSDIRGKMIWNQTYEMQSPMLRTCGNVVAVGDYSGRSIYVSDTEGTLGTITTTMPLRDFCVAANGVVAAVLDDSTVTAIYLYDTTGSELAYFKTTMSKSGYPIAIAISDDAKQVAVSYLKAEDGTVTSSVGFYNFSAVGQNYTDNMVGGYGYSDSVVPLLSYMNNDTVFALADNRLMFYQGSQKPTSLTDIVLSEEVRSVDYNDILFGTAGIVIYNENECVIYDWSGRQRYEGTFLEPIDCVMSGSSIAHYTLVTQDGIQTIELQ